MVDRAERAAPIGDAGLGPRLTHEVLDRLARRAVPAAESLEIVVAATGVPMGRVPHGTPDTVLGAAAAARGAQPSWAATPLAERTAILLRFAELVLDRQDEVLDLIQLENGKSRQHAFEEVLDVAAVARYYANTAEQHLRTRHRAGAVPVLTRAMEVRHPKGLVTVISPWNYPFTLGISDALPALVAGNAVLTLPDALTPYAALWAADLLGEAGLPDGLLQVVTGRGAELGEVIIDHADYVMFTGSTAVGRTVAARAAERLVEHSMELGGKNALLVLADADLDAAVPGAVRACFSNTGQLCMSMERLYVDTTVWDDFVPRFVRATEALRLGHRLDYGVDLGPLISAKQLDTVRTQVDDAVARGAQVLTGGAARPDLGPYFFAPTVLTGTTEEMTVFAEETFGPVVSLYRVTGDDDAIRCANASRYGLNASLWSRSADRAWAVATRLQAGSVNINGGYLSSWGSTGAPTGGWKDSGMGSRHGAHGITKYTDAQTVASQWVTGLSRPSVLSPAQYAAIMTRALRGLLRLPIRD